MKAASTGFLTTALTVRSSDTETLDPHKRRVGLVTADFLGEDGFLGKDGRCLATSLQPKGSGTVSVSPSFESFGNSSA